ncbi:MAG: DoxX family protein [Bacteroidales bacterium]|nr:DoxX family protein [Bacteroidales bacterium]MDD4001369.1 DoxX family protein [Bacteroidales bacterium]
MKYLGRIFRIIVGLVFIFSGFVKSVDPFGTAYKITEYFGAFGLIDIINFMPWLPIILSIFLCSLELIIGILLVLGYFKKSVNWLVGLMMLFFTVITLIDALTNKVSDCGCFGDAIKLTNWQTFWKNIILDILLILSFIFDKLKLSPPINRSYGRLIGGFVILMVLCFSSLNAVYEPIIDFRPWKEGNRMVPKAEDQKPPVSYALYKNNNTSLEREFGMEELMKAYEEDPNFISNWTFISSRVLNTNTIAADGFSMIGVLNDHDQSFEILTHPGTSFIFTIVNLDSPSKKAIQKIAKFEKEATNHGCQTAIITASSVKKWAEFTEKHNWNNVLMYSTDDKAIETMMRSNPGVVMIKDGVVQKKWSWRCLPDFKDLKIEKQEPIQE